MVKTWLITTTKKIENNKWYSTREIAFRGLIPWLPVQTQVNSYVNEKYSSILKPKLVSNGSRTRYFVLGRNIKEFIKTFEKDVREGVRSPVLNKPKPKSHSEEDVWYSKQEICQLELIPGITSYKVFDRRFLDEKKHLKSEFKNTLRMRTTGTGFGRRYYILASSIKTFLKQYPNGKIKK